MQPSYFKKKKIKKTLVRSVFVLVGEAEVGPACACTERTNSSMTE